MTVQSKGSASITEKNARRLELSWDSLLTACRRPPASSQRKEISEHVNDVVSQPIIYQHDLAEYFTRERIVSMTSLPSSVSLEIFA